MIKFAFEFSPVSTAPVIRIYLISQFPVLFFQCRNPAFIIFIQGLIWFGLFYPQFGDPVIILFNFYLDLGLVGFIFLSCSCPMQRINNFLLCFSQIFLGLLKILFSRFLFFSW